MSYRRPPLVVDGRIRLESMRLHVDEPRAVAWLNAAMAQWDADAPRG